MKPTLIAKLIKAHSSKNEEAFKETLKDLAVKQTEKGNLEISELLRNSYTCKEAIDSIPKDNSTNLELLEIIHPKVTFEDVALSKKILLVLDQIISEQKSAKDLLSIGITPTNKLLLCGPKNCGKTMTAMAIANKLKIPVAYVKLDSIVFSYSEQIATNIRKIFDYVKNKKILLFLDNLEAITIKKDDTTEFVELRRTINIILHSMNTLQNNIFLLATTTHHHFLTPDICKEFNSAILLDLPLEEQRLKIIERFFSTKLPKHNIDFTVLVTLSKGMTGLELEKFMQSLAKYCILQNLETNITKKEIATIWLNQNTWLINDKNDDYLNATCRLKANGLPLKTFQDILGTPISNLNQN